MVQLYFLSIFCNGIIGYMLFAGENEDDNVDKIGGPLVFSFFNPTFHLALGIISAVTGILKLFITMNNVPIFGDLLAALAGLLASFLLIFGVYRRDSSNSVINRESKLDLLGEQLLRYRKALGLVLLATALLHFLFPRALFL